MARRTKPKEVAATHLRRATRWAGLHEGDRVDVLEPPDRHASWTFSAHVTNVDSGASWVEVIGERAGERRRRSLRPDQVFPHKSVRRGAPTAASLSDAPQLPL